MPYWIRISIGFLGAPIALPGLASILVPHKASPLYEAFHEAVLWYSMQFAYPAALLIGIPAFILYHRNNWLTFRDILLAGIAIAALAPIVASALFGDVRLHFDSVSLFYRMIQGAIAATAFWFIARPDVMEADRTDETANGDFHEYSRSNV